MTPILSHGEAKAAISIIQAEKAEKKRLTEAKKEQRAKAEKEKFTWKQPEGWWGDALKSSDLRFRPMPTTEYADFITALASKEPEKVAKTLQHLDLRSLFTPDELNAMASPYYGWHNFSRDVITEGEPDGYTELQRDPLTNPSARRDKFQKTVFVVSGKPDDSFPSITGGAVVSGTFYRGFEMKVARRTKYIAKTYPFISTLIGTPAVK